MSVKASTKIVREKGTVEGARAWMDLQSAAERWVRSGGKLPLALEHARRALDVAASLVELTWLEGRAYVGSADAPVATEGLGKLVDVSRKAVEGARKERGRSRRLASLFGELVAHKRDPRWLAERLDVALDHAPQCKRAERRTDRLDRAEAAIKKHLALEATTPVVLKHALIALGVPQNVARDEAGPRKKLGT